MHINSSNSNPNIALLVFSLLKKAGGKVVVSLEEARELPVGWSTYEISQTELVNGSIELSLEPPRKKPKYASSSGAGNVTFMEKERVV